jgi:hypothetical protein
MSRWWSRFGTTLGLLVCSPVAPGGGGVAARAAEPTRGESLRVRVAAGAGTAVRRAVLSMKARLASEPCRLVLSDFTARAPARPLAAALDLRGRSLEQHVDSLVFEDGSGTRGCASPSTLAFTHVGGDAIYVCAARFARATWSDPELAEMLLIHEVLHT